MATGETNDISSRTNPRAAHPSRATCKPARPMRADTVLIPVLFAAFVSAPPSAEAQGGALRAGAAGGPVAGAELSQRFAIAPQPLAAALDRFSEATGISFAYTTSQLAGVRSPGVTGEFTPRRALARLLAGTGITQEFTSADTVTLVQAQQEGGPVQVGPITVEGQAARGSDTVEGFRAYTSTTATNADVPLMETPATVSVLTRDFLATLSVRELEDALQYVPGAGTQATTQGQDPAFNLRGFNNIADSVYIDGYLAPRSRYHFDPSLYERIDVLKGTSSILFGVASPGGVANYVSKKPLFETRYAIAGAAGSFDLFRGSVDATGPIGKGGNLAGRLIVVGHTQNQTQNGKNRDRSFNERVIVKPSLTWLTPGRGELNLSYEYSHQDAPQDPGVRRIDDGRILFNLAPSVGPEAFFEKEYHVFNGQFEQPLNDHWQFTIGATLMRSDQEGIDDFPLFGPLDGSPIPLFNNLTIEDVEQEEIKAELGGRFNTGDYLRHRITVGLNHREGQNELYWGRPAEERFIDPIAPVFPPAAQFLAVVPIFRDRLSETSFYVQDYISVGESLKVFGGLRYTDFETEAVDLEDSTFSSFGGDQVLDGSAGIIYNANTWFNPFFSYMTSTEGQRALLRSGDAPAREARQFELGLKSEWLDGALATTISVFDIEQTNQTEFAPDDPDFLFSVLSGTQKTQGLELEWVGRLTDRVRVYGGFSYLDAEFTDSVENDGNAPFAVPKHKVSLFGEYLFTGAFEGLSVGAGFIHVGERFGDNANSYELPTYERIDVTIGYQRDDMNVRLGIENLFDEDYIAGTNGSGHNLMQGTRRFFTLSAEYTF